jgi:hypothetical protein
MSYGNPQQQLNTQNPLAGLQLQPYQPKQLLPDPQAATSTLLSALQQAAQKQASSQAGSALAKQSHPQTLGQPQVQSNTGATSGQPQPNAARPRRFGRRPDRFGSASRRGRTDPEKSREPSA